MSWRLVARKDFEDVIRSWLLWSIIGVFLLLMGIIGLAASAEDLSTADGTAMYMLFNSLGAQLLLPVTALVVGYMAITAERQSGSLRILFGLSHDRRDVVFGKVLSRATAMLAATLVVCGALLALLLWTVGSVSVPTYLAFLGLTVLLTLAFTGIALGISSSTGSRATAMGAAIGSYVFFALLYHPIVAGVHYVVEGGLAGYAAPKWYFLLQRLDPMTAYREALSLVTGRYLSPMIGWPRMIEDVPAGATAENGLLLTERVGGELPVYLTEWFSVVVLLAWFAVPVAVGYWRFERADLN
ncbi:ABC transporter permease [Halostella sp. JP-L12]|uniref:ABC transporter permease n=1 Tax=Halostella TaxID=1843185 RepID=UPI000EF852EC|nr:MULTISPECIES: ABC transporter permease subunit [Halostella]NHN46628.1 ABC transporter permease [Halostella sp. JP-L12]